MNDDERAIRELIATWLEASKVGDTEKVLSLMSDDVVFLVAGQPPMRKAAFAASQSGLAQFVIDSSSEVQEIRVLGDWAWGWTRLRVAIAPRAGGAAMKRAGHTLSIFRKEPGGKWLLHRDANLLAPEKEA